MLRGRDGSLAGAASAASSWPIPLRRQGRAPEAPTRKRGCPAAAAHPDDGIPALLPQRAQHTGVLFAGTQAMGQQVDRRVVAGVVGWPERSVGRCVGKEWVSMLRAR